MIELSMLAETVSIKLM